MDGWIMCIRYLKNEEFRQASMDLLKVITSADFVNTYLAQGNSIILFWVLRLGI